MTISTIFLYFIIYSFIGWVLETIYCSVLQGKFVYRGFLYGPICPIYGVGALIVLFVLERFHSSPVLVFIFGMILTSGLEYVTSYSLELLFNMKWWDYSNKKYNLNGRICLLNSTLFAILCLVLVYIVHPEIMKLVNRVPEIVKQSVATGLLAIFTVDLGFTIASLLKLKSRLISFEKKISLKLEEGKVSKKPVRSYKELQKEFYTQSLESIFGFKPDFSTRKFLRSYPSLNSIKNPASISKIKEYISNRIN